MALKRPTAETARGRAFEGASEAGLSVAVGVVLGYYADRWLDTEPVFLFIFLILGAIAGFRRLLRIGVPPDTGPSGPAEKDQEADAKK